MKEQSKIPISKIKRTGKFMSATVKVGGNYLKHYAKKALQQEVSQEELDEENASDIYEMLSELKGGALKAAQMLSMDQGILPKAFKEKFQMAQYNAPPLSYPLVSKTFKQFLKKSPNEIFDTFSQTAVNAASIGQVHKATKDGNSYAVKVQYPGVADSMSNDLAIASTLAARLMNVKKSDMAPYMEEVEARLLEETDYELEIERSMRIADQCKNLNNVIFPKYYPEYSARRIITMDWMEGKLLTQWLAEDPPLAARNQIGQALWDFYNYQIHTLYQVHADPHPGNFIVTPDDQLAVIDFGCVKEIPQDFYDAYFPIIDPHIYNSDDRLIAKLEELEVLLSDDDDATRTMLIDIFTDAIRLLCRPFESETFDFSDSAYFDQINTMMLSHAQNPKLRKSGGARGPKHAIYINRVYFGLFNTLHELGADVVTEV